MVPVHPNSFIGNCIVGQNDAHGFFTFFALEQNGVSTEELKLVHLGLRQGDHRVIIIGGLFNDEAIGPLFPLQNSSCQIIAP